jgi:hypothetical protein
MGKTFKPFKHAFDGGKETKFFVLKIMERILH